MSLVQRAHGRHQSDLFAPAHGGKLFPQFGDGGDNFGKRSIHGSLFAYSLFHRPHGGQHFGEDGLPIIAVGTKHGTHVRPAQLFLITSGECDPVVRRSSAVRTPGRGGERGPTVLRRRVQDTTSFGRATFCPSWEYCSRKAGH